MKQNWGALKHAITLPLWPRIPQIGRRADLAPEKPPARQRAQTHTHHVNGQNRTQKNAPCPSVLHNAGGGAEEARVESFKGRRIGYLWGA